MRAVSAAQHLRVCFTKLWMGEGICFKAREAVGCALLDRMMGSVSPSCRGLTIDFIRQVLRTGLATEARSCQRVSQALSEGKILKMPTRQKIEYVIFDMDGMIQLL